MCGIVGYIGDQNAQQILLNGLEKLAYRGYDSAGIAVLNANAQLEIRKAQGKISALQKVLVHQPTTGSVGIGHTRWATHGRPCTRNAHPHTDQFGQIALVHNGIIENYAQLRQSMEKKGCVFQSETDTEVIAHMLSVYDQGDMCKTLHSVIPMLHGSFALAVITEKEPDCIFCAKNKSPLVVGHANGAGYIASDIPALLEVTRDVTALNDWEIGRIDRKGVTVYGADGKRTEPRYYHVSWDVQSARKDGYPHYMLKEIHEQPKVLEHTFAIYHMESPALLFTEAEARSVKKIWIVACGTAYHAGVYGKHLLERLAAIPVEVDVASEFRYRNPLIESDHWVVAISQSGETADTLAAVELAQKKNARIFAICNVVGSSLSRMAEHRTLYTHAGPEIAVASTKAYLTQVEMLLFLAARLGTLRKPDAGAATIIEDLRKLPQVVTKLLGMEKKIHELAKRLCTKQNVFFIGRGLDYAVALEAALKLKEVSYVFSDAYAAGELKHGPLALIEEGSIVVALATQEELVHKIKNNLQEVSARGAHVLAVCCHRHAADLATYAKEMLEIPDADSLLAPLLAAVAMQLFAYYMAVERGCDVDQPRHLAKSVTVE